MKKPTWKDVRDATPAVAIVAGVGIVGWVAYEGVEGFKQFIDSITKPTDDGNKKEIDKTGLVIDASKLTHPLEFYKGIAESSFAEMDNSLVVSMDNLVDLVKDLNTDELKQVYVDFGEKAGQIPLPLLDKVPIGSAHNLIWWYQNHGGPLNNTDRLKTIWTPTGLWT
jgi:hypothetical protein